MMKNKIGFFIAKFCFCALAMTSVFLDYPGAFAQETALQGLVQEALKNNPEIAAARAKWEAATKRPSQAGSLPNPIAGVRFKNVGFSEITLGDDPRSDLQVFFSQDIPFPGKLMLKEKSSLEEANAERWRYEAQTRRIIADLKETYYDWFLVKKSIEVTEKNKEILESFAKIAEKKYEVGDGIQQDVIKAQVEISRFIELLELFYRKDEIVQARLRSLLNRATQTPLGMPKAIEKSEFVLTYKEVEMLLDGNAPLLKARARIIKSREKSLVLAKLQYLPDFQVQGTYFNRDGGGGELRDIWQIGVGLKIPLYFWRKERFGVAEAVASLQESVARRNSVQQELYFQTARSYETIKTAGRLLGLYKNGIIPQSSLSLESSIAGYKVGSVDFLTLLDNIVTLFNFELEYYHQLTEHEQAIARLEEVIGVEVAVNPSVEEPE